MIASLALALALGAPQGLYAVNPSTVDCGKYEAELERSVIGKDPTLCCVSLVVRWSDLKPKKGVYDFSKIDGSNGYAAPYVRAGLTVNLVPFEFQTIVASTAPQAGVSKIVLGKALRYGMANRAQIFELYPQEWLAKDARHRAALRAAAAVLGVH